jgi:hypothetical protein
MTVERRYSTRYPVDFQVHILYRRRRFSYSKARNLSEQGMYLDIRAVRLPTGTLVELELHCLGKEWLIPAVVVHHHGGGVGVMFRDPQPELYRGVIEHRQLQMPPRSRARAGKQSPLY